ncbi:Protein O-GlcNAc transferase [Bertholletia excelsa]
MTMTRIKEVTFTSGPSSPPCTLQHAAPAVVFSVGGYTWNFFHVFIDAFVPLFITANSIFPDQDIVLVIVDAQDWWVREYGDLFHSFSKYPIVNLGNDADNSTRCFPSATVGLISHGFLNIDPKLIPNSKTIVDFHRLLEKTYCQGHAAVTTSSNPRPRLILVSRSGGVGRVILNSAEVKKAAEEEGFEVIDFEPRHGTPLHEACRLMSSSHAVLGVHGAALTYGLFLRPASVMVQVVGIGLEKVAELCFGKVFRDMGLDYLEYKIGVEESSLVDRYGKDDVVVRNPNALQIEWYDEIMEVYLRQQNVKLNISRLGGYLKKAYEKAKIVMVNGG